jgi:hypothetical protein
MMLVPLLAAAVLGAAGQPVHVVPTHRCTCPRAGLPMESPDSTLRKVFLEGGIDAWFVGRVVRAEPLFLPLELGRPDDSISVGTGGVYAFSVDSAWRGVRRNHVVVYSDGGGVGWCQHPIYRLGSRYVVAGRLRRDSLHMAAWCGPQPDPMHADSLSGRWLMRVLGEPNFRRRR